MKIFVISKNAIIPLCVSTKIRPLEKHNEKEPNPFFPLSCLNTKMRAGTYVGLRFGFVSLHEVIPDERTNLPIALTNLRKV